MNALRQPDYDPVRRLSPARKLAVMQALIRQAYVLKEAWVRKLAPDLPDEVVRAKVRELVAGARS